MSARSAQVSISIRVSRWVDAAEKNKCNAAVAFSDNDATGIAYYMTRPQGLGEGVPPLDLIAIADLLCFHVAIS